MQGIEELPRNITLIMIAHRLSTVRGCDRIWVLDKGHLIEDGPWEDLDARGGAFTHLLENGREQ